MANPVKLIVNRKNLKPTKLTFPNSDFNLTLKPGTTEITNQTAIAYLYDTNINQGWVESIARGDNEITEIFS